ncbi:MAG: ferrous iron transport protein A [Verrucomicrobia bacterium]|nr:ferrous iron transport protein A [Verrucomicrobiota bacterium]
MPSAVLALTSLAAGQSAAVTELRLPPETRARLQELGLVVGTAVQLVRFAPLGDPVEIHVRGSNLSLRRHEAEQIFVEAAP